jgi:hypothetical protein
MWKFCRNISMWSPRIRVRVPIFAWVVAWFLERGRSAHPRVPVSAPSTTNSAVGADIGCDCDFPPAVSKGTLQDVLDQQAIVLDPAGDKLLKLISGGDVACELLCQKKNTPKDGPFLLLAKVSWKDPQKYAPLLNELSGDDTLTDLFEPPGPVYLQILRCRPGQWNDLSRCFGAALKQQDQPLAPLQ